MQDFWFGWKDPFPAVLSGILATQLTKTCLYAGVAMNFDTFDSCIIFFVDCACCGLGVATIVPN